MPEKVCIAWDHKLCQCPTPHCQRVCKANATRICDCGPDDKCVDHE